MSVNQDDTAVFSKNTVTTQSEDHAAEEFRDSAARLCIRSLMQADTNRSWIVAFEGTSGTHLLNGKPDRNETGMDRMNRISFRANKPFPGILRILFIPVPSFAA
jgi:hypothetical protein